MRQLVCFILCLEAYAAATCFAATGDLLFQYESALGTLPARQGWTYESRCLKAQCPSNPEFIPGGVSECRFQGEEGNDCTLGHGCGPDTNPPFLDEHYNAPTYPAPTGTPSPCTYTEWLAFDDGEDYLESACPVAPPHRNLTFCGINATSWGPHAHPAFGAPGFINAPRDYSPLRIVTGGGVYGVMTLPAGGTNNRNLGQIAIRRNYTVPQGAAAVTLVAKMACGNRFANHEMISLGAFGFQFVVGVDGEDGSLTVGQFRRGTNKSSEPGLFGTRAVQVALARKNVQGPHVGEFFTVRVVLRNTGGVEAWLNDNPDTAWTGSTGTSSITAVQIHPDEQAGTMWVDYVRLYEGAVPPPPCADPRFDINRDGRVNGSDLMNGLNGFIDCATGPATPPAVFQSLPERCACHDVNGDGSIDMADFAAFQRCLSIDHAAADPACDD